jgi:drug/metabolite transporter (DMT)-like permease
MLIICAAASESTFNILSRKHRSRTQDASTAPLHPVAQTLLVSAIALVLSIIAALFTRPLASVSVLGWQEWLALVWYGLAATALAFVLFYKGVNRCDAYITAAFSGMMPLTSMLLSLLLLKEDIRFLQWVGGFLIILSMALMGKKKTASRQPAEL